MGIRQGADGAAIEMQDVKDDERGGIAGGQRGRCLFAGGGEASAEPVEIRSPVGVQADELPIEQHVAVAEGFSDRGELGELVTALPARP